MTDHEQNLVRRESSEFHEDFVLHYEITEEDFRTKIKLLATLDPNYRKSLTLFWVLIVVNILGSAGWSLDVVSSGEDLKFWHFINLGLAVLLLLVRYVARPARIKSLYQNSDIEGREYEACLLGDGVTILGPGTEASIQWPAFKGVVETEHHFFLIQSKLDAMTIPVRAFENETQKQACLDMIRNKVGDYWIRQNYDDPKKSSSPEVFD